MMKRLGHVLAVAVLFILCAMPCFAQQVLTKPVTEVIDGDTIVIDGGNKLRYVLVNTPEVGAAFGAEATALNKSLVAGKTVKAEICPAKPLDKYNRNLVWVTANGVPVNEKLVEAGLAVVFDERVCNLHGRAEKLWKLAIAAYDAKRGIWSKVDNTPIDHKAAINHDKQWRKVSGAVYKIQPSQSSVWINFSADWRSSGFSVRILKEDLPRFAAAGIDVNSLTGRKVQVFGRIRKERRHGPYITIRSPSQLKLL